MSELINTVKESVEIDLENLLNKTFEEYKRVTYNPSNYFLKSSVLYGINDSSAQAFKESIIKINR